MKSSVIPIFVACDDKYIPYATVTMASVLIGTSRDIDFYILDGGITEEHKKLVEQDLKKRFNNVHNLKYIKIDFDPIKKFPNAGRFSLNTYSRYFIAETEPKLKKVLYLDSDMVCVGDVADIYDTDLKEYGLGAVPYICNSVKYKNTGHYNWCEKQKKILKLNKKSKYFNAGLLLMDLSYFRKHKLQTKLVNKTIELKDIITCPDQDILNIVFENNYKQLSPYHNIVVDITNDLVDIEKYVKQANTRCVVIHYTGGFRMRPWQGSKVLKKYFWNVACKTCFYKFLRMQRIKNFFLRMKK